MSNKMKQITIAICFILLSSCTKTTPETTYYSTYLSLHYGFNTIEHEGCEYVIYSDYQKGGITHKGNCKFCKQRNIKYK